MQAPHQSKCMKEMLIVSWVLCIMLCYRPFVRCSDSLDCLKV